MSKIHWTTQLAIVIMIALGISAILYHSLSDNIENSCTYYPNVIEMNCEEITTCYENTNTFYPIKTSEYHELIKMKCIDSDSFEYKIVEKDGITYVNIKSESSDKVIIFIENGGVL